MNKTFYLYMLTIGLMAASCTYNKPQQFNHEETSDSIVVVNHNRTVFGLCGEGSAMNTLQLLTDSGDTLSLDLSVARESNNIFGGYECGDKMAVLLTNDRSAAELVINETTLLGNWVMPNPLDGSSIVGISLREGGIAESIDQSTIVYKTWRIVDGGLEIQSVREGGGDVEETNVYRIVKLDADSLVYMNEEDLFEYSRQ